MIRIPYGQSDFETIRLTKKFYQDRTQFITKLEEWNSPYPAFLRPRRFGKSLFVSILHYYYGLEYQSAFSTLFGDLYIGKNPTALANTFLVLRFEFSGINTRTHDSTYQGFLTNVVSGARTFLGAYGHLFTDEQQRIIEQGKSPEAIIKAIFDFVKKNQIPYKMYVLIDEYDHFSNELLSFDLKRFKKEVSRNGFVRKFYESIKTAAGVGIVDRVFITGVSPVTLDSLTSGFNIADNISFNPIFHSMMGFTEEEVKDILHLSEIPIEEIPDMMIDLRAWYDGYLFTPDVEQHLFNPDMVLYFLKEYGIKRQYPYEMLDTNILSDYRKVRNIFKIGGQENERFELLEELVKNGFIDFPLTRVFNLESNFTKDDFLSLLYYMGMLTFREIGNSDWRFEIPNYVIKKLYFEYFTAIFLEKTRFSTSNRPINRTIDAFVNNADPFPFLKIVEEVLLENHANRDEMVYGEKHLQTLIIGLFFPYKAFQIHSEYESKRTYPDIFLERIPGNPMKHEIVLELKYVKKSKKEELPLKIAEAQTQLNNYMKTARFSRSDVRGFYIIFLGGHLYECKEFGSF
jgi:hypothetical protein